MNRVLIVGIGELRRHGRAVPDRGRIGRIGKHRRSGHGRYRGDHRLTRRQRRRGRKRRHCFPIRGGGSSGIGGTAAKGGSSSGGAAPTTDTTAPRVMTVTPVNGSSGVSATDTIKLTFSEAMNTASVATALSVTELLPGDLDLTWSAGSTVLAIKAKSGLSYATGTSTTLTAKTYSVALTAGAKDLAGNGLAPAFSSDVTTLRWITQVLAAETSATFNSYELSMSHTPVNCATASTTTYPQGMFPVGYFWNDRGPSGTMYDYVTFNLASLGTPTTIEVADFQATQGASKGDFYGTGGTAVLDKLVYQTVDNTILDAAVSSNIGILSNSATVATPSISVLASLRADVAGGIQRELYRVSGPNSASNNTFPNFQCSGFSLQITYLLP